MKRINFIFIALFYFSLGSYCQEINSGTRYNLQTKVADVCKYTCHSYSNNSIFYNHFSIFLNSDASKIDTLYTIDIDYNLIEKRIIVNQKDLKTNQSQTKSILFQPLSSLIERVDTKPIYCVKDYLFNDTLLSLTNNNAAILFTIADTISPLIFLHEFLTIDGNYNFKLDKFRQSFLSPHLIHAKKYWSLINDEIIIEKNKNEIFRMVKEENEKLDKVRDSIVSKLNENWRVLKLTEATPSHRFQLLFTEKMDKIFQDYFYKTDTCNYEIQGIYTVKSRIDHSLEIVKKITYSSDNNKKTVFLNQLNQIDSIAIKHLDLENEKILLYSDDLYDKIINDHNYRCKALKLLMQKQNVSYDFAFSEKILSIGKELNLYPKMEEVPTVYEYPFTYVSKSELHKWVLKNHLLTDKSDSAFINENNNKGFYNVYPKAKNGRYTVRLNRKIINNYVNGPEIDLVDRKYKFMTHFGFNACSFISLNDLVIKDETYDGEFIFWNLFYIYHHFGVFGGFSEKKGSLLNNYREGGIYLAPSNIFFFKLGLAQNTDLKSNTSSVKPLLGVSLFFSGFQMEGGYNFAIKSPYAGIGFNIPFNH